MNTYSGATKPFLKWAGGKRWAADLISSILANHPLPYVEPFLGSGAVFFRMCPKTAVLSDINAHLINTYEAVRDTPNALAKKLAEMPITKDDFFRYRSCEPICSVDQAARFLYLNRTAFNGLYRVNRRGHFNVPFGCKPGTTLQSPLCLEACSRALERTSLTCATYTDALTAIDTPSTVYLDPPYADPDSRRFLRYAPDHFAWADQIKLAALMQALTRAGHVIVASNAYHPAVIALYSRKDFIAFKLTRSNNMSAKSSCRGDTSELLIISKHIVRGALPTETLRHLHDLRAELLDLSAGSNAK
jgi:DNA adenine methylase